MKNQLLFFLLALCWWFGNLTNAIPNGTTKPLDKNEFETDTRQARNRYHRPYELPPNYNSVEIPLLYNGDSRVHASVGILIHSLRNVDELHEDITLELDLKTRWTDEVIQNFDSRTPDDIFKDNKVPYTSLDSSYLHRIWWPSIIFNDVAEIIDPNLHKTIHPNPVQLRIFAHGRVQMITRLVLKIYCPMDFTYYPADTQTCRIRLRSHAYSDNDLRINWNDVIMAKDGSFKKYDVYLADRTDGSFNKFLHDIKEYSYRNPLEQRESPESYQILEFSLSAKRKLSFHVMQTFVPSAFLIIITWLSFFLPTSMLEARIGIAMTTLLTLTAMFSSIKEYIPQVSYIKAIDIWMLVCITLVFLTLLEFALLIWLRKTIDKNMKRNNEYSKLNSVILRMKPTLRNTLTGNPTNLENTPEAVKIHQSLQNQKLLIYKRITKQADKYGFLFLAGTFVFFNIIFWSWLMVKSKHFELNANLDNNAPFS